MSNGILEIAKQVHYFDTLLRDTLLAINSNEKKWISSNKIVVEPGGFVRWLVKSTAIFEKKYQGEPFISNHKMGLIFALTKTSQTIALKTLKFYNIPVMLELGARIPSLLNER